jgi:hypothetical protein
MKVAENIFRPKISSQKITVLFEKIIKNRFKKNNGDYPFNLALTKLVKKD